MKTRKLRRAWLTAKAALLVLGILAQVEAHTSVPPEKFSANSTFCNLPPTKEDFEYYITGRTARGKELVWPATAPDLNQTVVVWQHGKCL